MIADDLTGACDAAVAFAARGLRSTVWLNPAAAPFHEGVNAISTDTRDAPPEAFRDALSRLPALEPCLIFKKIDSTLRGHPGAEIAILLETFACDTAIITPAFPAMGRTVENGWLRVAGAPDFTPIHVATRLSLAGPRFTAVDAASDRDLDDIVATGLASHSRILWAGSAGLASALARALGGAPLDTPRPALQRGVLFIIGSDHPVTLEQQQRLLACRPTVQDGDRESIRAALDCGEHVMLRFPRGGEISDRLLAVHGHAAALALSGGDTASAVCRALGTTHIELVGEIAPAIPHGFLDGAARVATKSGAFGAPDALIQIADFFQCP